MIGPLARYEHSSRRFLACAMVGEADLHSAVDRLGTRCRKKQPVEPLGQQSNESRRQSKRFRMSPQETRREIQLQDLIANSVGNLNPAMACGSGKQTGNSVQNRSSLKVVVIDTLCRAEKLGINLKVAVRRKREPLVFHGRAHRITCSYYHTESP